ncbi:hypothetical protein LR48_Vigan07g245000 [Vigna angularis]|uniref:Uncharacterized protein n=2 Tax=Phaseolus angularis TaxID=3914 RepID=A0A0L9V1B6_PHAAN|nr:hypothetical protein LR48_Vigan07g245000 [Vigna angularis]BAT82396.1 hypothetical protein VIGAN_03240900 [Vigna angularis var. angularis]
MIFSPQTKDETTSSSLTSHLNYIRTIHQNPKSIVSHHVVQPLQEHHQNLVGPSFTSNASRNSHQHWKNHCELASSSLNHLASHA